MAMPEATHHQDSPPQTRSAVSRRGKKPTRIIHGSNGIEIKQHPNGFRQVYVPAFKDPTTGEFVGISPFSEEPAPPDQYERLGRAVADTQQFVAITGLLDEV